MSGRNCCAERRIEIMNDLDNWEVVESHRFADESVVQVIFDRYKKYYIKAQRMELDLLLVVAPRDPHPGIESRQKMRQSDELTINVPSRYSYEMEMIINSMRHGLPYTGGVFDGFQEAEGIKLRKLLLFSDAENSGEVVGYGFFMNDVGDGSYVRLPLIAALANAFTRKMIPIYAAEGLFLTEPLRKKMREMADVAMRLGISLEMSDMEKVEIGIHKDIHPEDLSPLVEWDALLEAVGKEELEKMKTLAIAEEKYEWAQFLTELIKPKAV